MTTGELHDNAERIILAHTHTYTKTRQPLVQRFLLSQFSVENSSTSGTRPHPATEKTRDHEKEKNGSTVRTLAGSVETSHWHHRQEKKKTDSLYSISSAHHVTPKISSFPRVFSPSLA